MKQKLYLIISLLSLNSFGLELYKDDNKKLNLNSYIAYSLNSSKSGDEPSYSLEDSGSSIALSATDMLSDSLSISGLIKANINLSYKLLDKNKDFEFENLKISSRNKTSDASSFISYNSGYIALKHKELGVLIFGKKEGLYSKSILSYDPFIEKGNTYGSSSVFDGSYSGTGRGDSLFQYIFDSKKFSFGLQYQLDRTEYLESSSISRESDADISENKTELKDKVAEYSNGYSAFFKFNFPMNFSFAASANYHMFTLNNKEYNSYIIGSRLSYSKKKSKGYFASIDAAYSENHSKTYHEQNFAPSALHSSFLTGYSFDKLKIYAGLYHTYISGNSSRDLSNGVTTIPSYFFNNISIGASYYFIKNLFVHLEASLTVNTDSNFSNLEQSLSSSIIDSIKSYDGISLGVTYSF